MSSKDLVQFLYAAKSATYAAEGNASTVAPILLNSKQLEYRDETYLYRDIYFGTFQFVGQEIVYFDDRAVWSMSYSGGALKGVASTLVKPIYAALRQALRNTPVSLPLRGPANCQVDDMTYTCSCEGSLEWFHGIEAIEQNGVCLYALRFSGGSLA